MRGIGSLSNSNLNSVWEDLIISILSVNNYPIDKTLKAVKSLRASGVLDVINLGKWEATKIAEQLKNGEYDRGPFLNHHFAERLAALGTFVKSRGKKECEKILDSKNPNEIKRLLRRVKGIGPKVLSSYFSLRGIKEN